MLKIVGLPELEINAAFVFFIFRTSEIVMETIFYEKKQLSLVFVLMLMLICMLYCVSRKQAYIILTPLNPTFI